MKISLLLFLSLISSCVTLSAQNQYRARLGTSLAVGTKIAAGNNLNWLAPIEFGFYVRVDPVQEQGLGFIGRFNFLSDPIRCKIEGDKRFSLHQNNLTFDGLISFPTKKEPLHVLVGIGLEYALEPAPGYGISSDAGNATIFSIDLDSMMVAVNDYRRTLIPSLSAGITWQPLRNKKFSTYLLLKQYLLRLFTEDLSIPYKTNGRHDIARMNYIPCYLKLGVNYDLW